MKNLYTSKSAPAEPEKIEKVDAETLPPTEPKKDNTKIILIVLGLILIIGLFYFQKLNKADNE